MTIPRIGNANASKGEKTTGRIGMGPKWGVPRKKRASSAAEAHTANINTASAMTSSCSSPRPSADQRISIFSFYSFQRSGDAVAHLPEADCGFVGFASGRRTEGATPFFRRLQDA